MARTLILLTILLTLTSCGKLPLGLLGGGGPNVAANTQIGKENYQGINTTVDRSVRPQARAEGPVDTIDQSNNTTNNTEIDPFMLLLLILGWLAPSPQEMGRGIYNLFRKKQ
jgi:hypothetical protein